MAYVSISGDLIERVKAKVTTMANSELKSLGEMPDQNYSPDANWVQNFTWKEHIHLRDIIPNEFCKNLNTLRLRDVNELVVDIHFVNNIRVPSFFSEYSAQTPDWDAPELAVYKEYLAKRYEISTRWKSAKDKVIEFLKSCKSLNEAVKLWPDVTMYIHNSDVDRMEVKRLVVKESKALEALKQLDTDALVSNVVISRLSGA